MLDLTMEHEQFCDWLRRHQCCKVAYHAVVNAGCTEQQAWEQCEEPSWLLWWHGQCGVTAVQLVTCATACVRCVQQALSPISLAHVTHLMDTMTECTFDGEFNTAALVLSVMYVVELACSIGLSRRGACAIIRRVCS